MSFIILLGAGILGIGVGCLTGLFGAGGGFILTPAFMVLLGVPGPVAVGTGLAAIVVNSSFSMMHRKGSGTIDWKLGGILSSASIVGVLLGSQLLDVLKWLPYLIIHNREIEAMELVLLVLFFILLSAIAAYLYLDYRRNGPNSPAQRIGLFSRIRIPPYVRFSSLERPELPLFLVLFLGLILGFLTGLLGIGGGVILLPALVYLVGQRTGTAAGTSLVVVWISSVVGVIRKGSAGDVHLWLLVSLLLGGIAGTWLGTKLSLRTSGPQLRLCFIYVIILAIGIVAFRLSQLFFAFP